MVKCRNCGEEIDGGTIEGAIKGVAESNENMFVFVHSNENTGISICEPFCSKECMDEYYKDWDKHFGEMPSEERIDNDVWGLFFVGIFTLLLLGLTVWKYIFLIGLVPWGLLVAYLQAQR